ncbi:MAG: AsnC family protein, partial [Ruminococcaceae bacterium]|nr:AsnC family protein [Oscillospiraceae bacterium]
MDKTDYEILACLKENARENATNIGAKINLSTSAVIERIKKFEASGLIKQ